MMRLIPLLAFVLFGCASAPTPSATGGEIAAFLQPKAEFQVPPGVQGAIIRLLQQQGVAVAEVSRAPIGGLYQAVPTTGESVIYLTEDLAFAFVGKLYDFQGSKDISALSTFARDLRSKISAAESAFQARTTERTELSVLLNPAGTPANPTDIPGEQDPQVAALTPGLDATQEILDSRIAELKKKINAGSDAGAVQADEMSRPLQRSDIEGSLFRDDTGKPLSDAAVKAKLAGIYGRINEAWSLVYPATGMERGGVLVFLDHNCPHCARFYRDIPKLNAAGYTVKALFYPRAGLDSADAVQMAAAWCADDQKAALSELFAGKTLDPARCEQPTEGRSTPPVAAHTALATMMGIEATPLIVSSTGEVMTGYPRDGALEAFARLFASKAP